MSDPWGIPGQGADPSDQTGAPFETQPFGSQPSAGQLPPQFTGDAAAGGMAGGTGPAEFSQYPYAQPGYGYPMPPVQKQSNGLAIAGFVLAFLFSPLGLILSIIGLVRSGKLGGAGKKFALSGVILSIVFCALSIFLIAKVSGSTAEDPGCTTAESSLTALEPQMTSVETQLSADESSSDVAAVKTDLNSMVTYLQTAQGDLSHSGTVAVHPQVKTEITAVSNDLTTLVSAFHAISAGDDSQLSAMTTAATQLQTDGTALDTLCSSY